jgi:Glycosyl hydrolase family 14
MTGGPWRLWQQQQPQPATPSGATAALQMRAVTTAHQRCAPCLLSPGRDRELTTPALLLVSLPLTSWFTENGSDGTPRCCAQEAPFFRSWGGSWDTEYGRFFLGWYSGELLAHGERLMGVAAAIFKRKWPVRWWLSARRE